MPVTLIVKRPDGTEFTRFTHALQASGALHQAIELPKSSRRGRWSVAAHIDPKAAPVGRVEFSVEDFVPEKLKVELTPDQPILRPGQANSFAVSADFLYGAPASGLTVEADMRVTVDDQPFPDFRQVLRSDRRASARSSSRPSSRSRRRTPTTAGKSRLEWGGDQVKDTVLPLRAQLTARVFEPGGGRATQDRQDACRCAPATSISASARPSRAATPREGADTEFDIVAVDADGQADRPPGGRIPHRAHRLRLPVVPGRRPLALAVDAERTAARPPTRWRSRPMRRRACRASLNWGRIALTIVDNENKAPRPA